MHFIPEDQSQPASILHHLLFNKQLSDLNLQFLREDERIIPLAKSVPDLSHYLIESAHSLYLLQDHKSNA